MRFDYGEVPSSKRWKEKDVDSRHELWASLNIVLSKHVYSPQVQLIDTMHCVLNKISVPVRIDRDGNFAFSLDMFVKHPNGR